MIKFSELLEKIKKKTGELSAQKPAPASGEGGDNSIKAIRNWYEERFDSILVQRNLLLLLLLVLLVLSIVSVAVVTYVINTKKFDPFVIQIDDSTGMAKIVNPLTPSILDGNEALARYFIKKYVVARETYNPVDFDTEAKKNVRILSSNSIYWDYRGYLKNDQLNPSVKYGQKNTTYLVVKSWSKIGDKKYILRFSLNETAGNRQKFDKIAVVEFDYLPMELNDEERDINPVGFQVTGYRIDDDNS